MSCKSHRVELPIFIRVISLLLGPGSPNASEISWRGMDVKWRDSTGLIICIINEAKCCKSSFEWWWVCKFNIMENNIVNVPNYCCTYLFSYILMFNIFLVIFPSQILLYFLQSTPALSFNIDAVPTLSTCISENRRPRTGNFVYVDLVVISLELYLILNLNM